MDDSPFILKAVTVVLATILLSMVGAMLYGLFDTRVDNARVFAIIGPAFQTIVGCFVGILGGRALGKKD
jgi:hypothetical protein